MTRINLVPPRLLTNEHLMAEYKELPRVFTRVKWRIARGQTLANITISKTYTLNTGHETFFNDKLAFLLERYRELYKELRLRGYNLDNAKHISIMRGALELRDTDWFKDYAPTPDEVYLSMARLAKRSKSAKVQEELAS